MPTSSFSLALKGSRFHFVGAKGTGMAALAEIFVDRGALLTGSDVPDVFYTDAILKSLGVRVYEGFSASNLGPGISAVIYSDAYNPSTNPELIEAGKRGLPIYNYAQALGALSRLADSSGVAGVHGKTTTTAMAGTLLAALGCPATTLTGSVVSSFHDRCTSIGGSEYFVAETDEYRRHFLEFSPKRILLTSVESDHQDYYPTYESIVAAYREYGLSLPEGGTLVYCADDPGAKSIFEYLASARPDLTFVPYGFEAQGAWRIRECRQAEGVTLFRLEGFDTVFELKVPGKHLVLDAAGALALAYLILTEWKSVSDLNSADMGRLKTALRDFRGSKRRSEIVGEAKGILVMDDYAHHPTALRATIAGLREFWPRRRIVVDFMSHTYSRTMALLDEFASSLDQADCIILHGIYASAREAPIEGFSGRNLYDKVRARHPELQDLSRTQAPSEGNFIYYEESHLDSAPKALSLLKPGDLFITMGAGDNWKLGRKILESLEKESR
jgi:UDP-N-acetylmuramate--alanine ligase